MKSPFLLLAGLGLLAACSGRVDSLDLTPRSPQPVGEVELRFAWPAPATVAVREQVQRGERVMEVRYHLRIERAGDGLAVRPEGVELAQLDGRRPETDEDRAALEPVLAGLSASLPPLRIAPDGTYLGIEDFDGWRDRTVQSMKALADRMPEKLKASMLGSLAVLQSPANRATVEAGAGDRWETWVGAWRGLRAVPGGEGTRKTRAYLPWSGPENEVELPFQMVGWVRSPADHVRVELGGEIEFAPSGLARAVSGVLGAGSGRMTARIARASILEPSTMRPVHAEAHRLIRGEGGEGGGARREALEVSVWDFEWPAAATER